MSIFHVELTWNDPNIASQYCDGKPCVKKNKIFSTYFLITIKLTGTFVEHSKGGQSCFYTVYVKNEPLFYPIWLPQFRASSLFITSYYFVQDIAAGIPPLN